MPSTNTGSHPDYFKLVEFLVEPLLETPESLSIDCEQVNNQQRVWIRLALEGTDKGRVFGRGGRNLQAIRTVLQTAAAAAGQSLHLELYEQEENSSETHHRSRVEPPRHFAKRKPHSPRPEAPGFSLRPRFSE